MYFWEYLHKRSTRRTLAEAQNTFLCSNFNHFALFVWMNVSSYFLFLAKWWRLWWKFENIHRTLFLGWVNRVSSHFFIAILSFNLILADCCCFIVEKSKFTTIKKASRFVIVLFLRKVEKQYFELRFVVYDNKENLTKTKSYESSWLKLCKYLNFPHKVHKLDILLHSLQISMHINYSHSVFNENFHSAIITHNNLENFKKNPHKLWREWERVIIHRQQHVALVSACGEDRKKHRNKSRLERVERKTSKVCKA